MSIVEPGQIWRDTRDRWLRVDEVTDGQAAMVVIAQQIGDRVMAPMRAVSMDVEKLPKRMALVDAAPAATGPDLAEVLIDYVAQTIALGDGKPIPYYVGSSGPRVKFLDDDAAAIVTVAFYTGCVRGNYGGAR